MIQADERMLRRAKRRAAERGISLAQLIREALTRELGAERQPRPLSIGSVRSSVGDMSRRSSEDEYQPPAWRSS